MSAMASLPSGLCGALGIAAGGLADAAPAAALGLLHAQFEGLHAQALEVGLPASVVDGAACVVGVLPLPEAGAATVGGATFAAAEDALAELERRVVEATATKRSTAALAAAARGTLERLGLEVTVVEGPDGTVLLSGGHPDGRTAAVTLDGRNLEVCGDDPGSTVHPLDPAASETCRPAVELVTAIHSGLETHFQEAGVVAGAVEQMGRPVRGARAPQRRLDRQAAVRRTKKSSL